MDTRFANSNWGQLLKLVLRVGVPTENQGARAIVQNSAGYDARFVSQSIVKNKQNVYPGASICPGGRTTHTNFDAYNTRLSDSIHVDASALSSIPKTCGIETLKGHFPHVQLA